MRLIIQRVSKASVNIAGKQHSCIGSGLMVLLGIEESDNLEDLQWLVPKLMGMRIFSDAEGKMNLDVKQVNGELLIVSQFTLHASTKKGNRPSFIKAARPEQAIPLYETFIAHCAEQLPGKVHSGVFGADMQVELLNDGPVTIFLDSRNRE